MNWKNVASILFGKRAGTDGSNPSHFEPIDKTTDGRNAAHVQDGSTPDIKLAVEHLDVHTGSQTDTDANNTIHGRLAKLYTRLGTLLGLLPASLGQKSSALSLAAVLSAEQEGLLAAARDRFDTSDELMANALLENGLQNIVVRASGSGTPAAGGTVARQADANCPRGDYAAVLTTANATTSGTSNSELYSDTNAMPGQSYKVSIYVALMAANRNTSLLVDWLDGNGNLLNTVTVAGGPSGSTAYGSYRGLSGVVAAPANAMYLRAYTRTPSFSGIPAGEILRQSGFSVKQVFLPATLGQKASAASLAAVLSTEQEAILTARNNAFATLLNFLPDTTGKELRRVVVGTDVYHLRALDGTATSAASWEAARFYQDANENILRTRYRTGVVADNPSAGWT